MDNKIPVNFNLIEIKQPVVALWLVTSIWKSFCIPVSVCLSLACGSCRILHSLLDGKKCNSDSPRHSFASQLAIASRIYANGNQQNKWHLLHSTTRSIKYSNGMCSSNMSYRLVNSNNSFEIFFILFEKKIVKRMNEHISNGSSSVKEWKGKEWRCKNLRKEYLFCR